MSKLLPGASVRLRRGRRRDVAGVRALLGDASERRERYDRRLLTDLGTDVYVAEDAGGEIVGVVAVAYLPSLRLGRAAAVLDAARTRDAGAVSLLAELIAFAEERARRRGCREVSARIGDDDVALRAALTARGYRTGAVLVSETARGTT